MDSLNLDLGAEELREVDLDLDLSNDLNAINITSNNEIKNIDLGSANRPKPNLMVHDSNSNIGLGDKSTLKFIGGYFKLTINRAAD